MHANEAFHKITTLIQTTFSSGQTQGSGFYYQKLAPKDPTKDAQWLRVDGTWVITNRHVVLRQIRPFEEKPTTIVFHIRKIQENLVSLAWQPIVLDAEQIHSRARFHPDPRVDVCAINVLDLLTNPVRNGERLFPWYAVHQENHPGQNNIHVEAGDDVLIVGYPRGYYDQKNCYPIVKSGTIASGWDLNFNDEPYFLVDAKLFPGSSGSIVVSKPRDFAVVDGKMMWAKEKQFAFLGVYSGEPFLFSEHPLEFEEFTLTRKQGFNLGIVWYSKLVDEILDKGITIDEAIKTKSESISSPTN